MIFMAYIIAPNIGCVQSRFLKFLTGLGNSYIHIACFLRKLGFFGILGLKFFISLLDSFSKIYEKLFHNRIIEFFDQNNTLFDMQYAFRPGRSCEHALLNAQNTILNFLSKKKLLCCF